MAIARISNAGIHVIRMAAKTAGKLHYSTGFPCRNGHIAPRFVSTQWCTECARLWNKARKPLKDRTPRIFVGTDTDAAYAAGFFDGEGHIAIIDHKASQTAKSVKSKYQRYQLQCSVSQARPAVIEWFASMFGGRCRFTEGSRSYNDTRYARFDWCIGTAAAADFLRVIRPWLIVKADQADLAMEFQATMDRRRGAERVPDDVLQFRRECHARIRAMRAEVS